MTDHSLSWGEIEITVSAEFTYPDQMGQCVTNVVEGFAATRGLKNIRNQRLYICKSTDIWPRAIEPLDLGRQRINLPSEGNFCAQAVYYLGHELGHVVSGFERRFSQNDKRNLWIEEIVCGATSLYALQYASRHWKHADYFPRDHFRSYLEDLYKTEFYLPTSTLPASEFEEMALSDSGLALSMRPYSRLLCERAGGAVVADACDLATIEPGFNRRQFLEHWAMQCKSLPSTPNILRDMLLL